MSETTQNTPLSAFTQVKEAAAQLRSGLHVANAEIASLEGEIAALPNMRPPFEDLKTAMLDLAKATGERHAAQFRLNIIEHATGRKFIDAVSQGEIGKPMQLGRLERAINDGYGGEAMPIFIQARVHAPVELPLFALFFDMIKGELEKAMLDITPEDFGYNKVSQNEIGPSRAEMRRLIDEKKARIEVVKRNRENLISQLSQLGIPIRWKDGVPVEMAATL